MSSIKDKNKIEKFVTAWENDIGRLETSITSFKSEIQAMTNEINNEIHDMNLNLMEGQLKHTRRIQSLMVKKMEDMEKLIEQQIFSENNY